jgi:peptide/nickel transport system permease protein
VVQTALDASSASTPPETAERTVRKRHFIRVFVSRNKLGTFGFILLAAILLLTIVGPFIVPEAGRTDVKKIYAQPEWGHPLGFDHSGRDIWAQIVHGGRSIIWVATLAAFVGTAIGVIFGALAAMIGGWFETATLTLSEIVLTVPSIILLGVLAAFIKLDSPLLLAAILASTSWPVLLLAVRSQVLSLREREYVEAARMLDLGTPRILFREILPNMASYIVINFVFHMTGAIYGQVILYFLGLISFKNSNWGLMIQDAYRRGAVFNQDSQMGLLAPIFMIVMLIWSLTLIARSLEDVFNPRLREL